MTKNEIKIKRVLNLTRFLETCLKDKEEIEQMIEDHVKANRTIQMLIDQSTDLEEVKHYSRIQAIKLGSYYSLMEQLDSLNKDIELYENRLKEVVSKLSC